MAERTYEDWRRALPKLKRVGGQLVGSCPVCGGDDRFYVTAQGKAFCRQCCPDGRNPDAFRAILAVAFGDAGHHNGGPPPERKPTPAAPSRTQPKAFKIIRESRPIAGTPAERYLAKVRGITQDDYRIGALRFHPAAEYRGVLFPALVAPVMDGWSLFEDVADDGHYPGEFVACHCVMLNGDGTKSEHPVLEGNPRRSFGPIGQGAVYLGQRPEGLVALAEGVENAISAAAIAGVPCHPVATLSAGLMPKWNPPAWCGAVLIAADGDPAGMQHAMAAHQRFTQHGITTVVRQFTDGVDANDLLKWHRSTNGHDG